LNTHLN